MNKINLALTSDDDKGAQVHLNAVFESREQAIAFHAKVAALCEHANRANGPKPVWHPRALLGNG